MRIDCHTHTSSYSGCSRLKPAQLCTLAQKRGLHGLVITEHRRQWPPEELASLQKKFPGLQLYNGVELSTREGYDVVCITGNTILDLPAFPNARFLQNLRAEHGEAMFCFVAHPFRYRSQLLPELQDILEVVEGIEMNSMNILKGGGTGNASPYLPQNHRMYEKARRAYGLIPVYNSDAHTPESVASIANELPGDHCPQDVAGLAGLLRQGLTAEWQNTPQVEEFIERRIVF